MCYTIVTVQKGEHKKMYISEELHEILYQVGLWWCGIFLAVSAALFIWECVKRWVRRNKRLLKIRLAIMINTIESRKARLRYKAAMKVFNKPLSDTYKAKTRPIR